MTLRDLFHTITVSPAYALWFLISVPLLCFLVSIWQDKTVPPQQSSSRYFYAVIVYLVCIPGIFAFMLNLYLFLFERQSIWELNLIIQFLPILTMVLTLMYIKRQMPFEFIPGFGKISGFMTLITAIMGILWFVDRLHIYAITYVPFHFIAIGFVILLLVIRFAWNKLF